MRQFLRSLFPRNSATQVAIANINRLRSEWADLPSPKLREICHATTSLEEVIAITALVAGRVLSLDMFDVQLQGALALAHGRIIEMQTGEGKTLAAVPAIIWYARQRGGV